MLIRDADSARDAAACAAIYAPYVRDTAISFEDIPPTPAEMAARIERLTNTHAWLVAENEHEILGYAYACPHRERTAYRWTTEVSAYVDASRRRHGAGRQLYDSLLNILTEEGYQVALAVIGLPNDPSVAFHESFGFEPAGVFHRLGFKFGEWWDVGWWQLDLASGPAG